MELESPFTERESQTDRILAMVIVDQALTITGGDLYVQARRTADIYRCRLVNLHITTVIRTVQIVAQQHGD
jgi:hypothetical protein